jgi:hypothetical protein
MIRDDAHIHTSLLPICPLALAEIGIDACEEAIIAGSVGMGSAPQRLKVALAANGLRRATTHTKGLG